MTTSTETESPVEDSPLINLWKLHGLQSLDRANSTPSGGVR